MRVLVVIPAYYESRRLPSLFCDIAVHIKKPTARPFDVHFLIVDDGSGEEECKKIRSLIESHSLAETVSLLQLDINRGKGGALKAGFKSGLRAGYDYLGFMDADGSVPVSALYEAIDYFQKRADTPLAAVAASRVEMLGRDISRSLFRHYVSRVFATFVSLYFRARMYDSQCGLKIFKGAVLKRYLDIPTDFRWVWDTQLVMAMLHGGETVHEVPIDWREVKDSKMSLLRDPLIMAAHLIAFKRRLSCRLKADGPS